jgi:hypothetical protein
MRRNVFYSADPTYASVLAKFRKEAREAERDGRAMAAFRVVAAIRLILRIGGYRLREELVMEDVQTGAVFRSGGKSDGK